MARVVPGADAAAVESALGSAAGFDALLEADRAALLAAPRLVTLRGKDASMTVGGDLGSIEVSITPTTSRDASLVKVLRRTGGGMMTLTIRSVERVRGAGVVTVEDAAAAHGKASVSQEETPHRPDSE